MLSYVIFIVTRSKLGSGKHKSEIKKEKKGGREDGVEGERERESLGRSMVRLFESDRTTYYTLCAWLMGDKVKR